jgi:hypothetical protein
MSPKSCTVILGRDGIGYGVEADFESWVEFVRAQIGGSDVGGRGA